MNKLMIATAALALLAGCSQPARQSKEAAVTDNAAVPAPAPQRAPAAANRAEPAVQPAPETPRPTLDPKSSTAAEELVRGFVDLLNAGKFNQAYMLLGSAAPPRAQFDQRFTRLSKLSVTMGAAGDQEGAAGSIYLSVPLTISGELNGNRVSKSATAILRRVNDVPGSTEAQRHWHIERIDWGSGS